MVWMGMCREARTVSMALPTTPWIRVIRRRMSTEAGRVLGAAVLRLMALLRTGRTAGLRKVDIPSQSFLHAKHCVGVKVLVAENMFCVLRTCATRYMVYYLCSCESDQNSWRMPDYLSITEPPTPKLCSCLPCTQHFYTISTSYTDLVHPAPSDSAQTARQVPDHSSSRFKRR